MPLKKPLKLNDFHSTQNVTQERCKAENRGSDRSLVDDAVNISTNARRNSHYTLYLQNHI